VPRGVGGRRAASSRVRLRDAAGPPGARRRGVRPEPRPRRRRTVPCTRVQRAGAMVYSCGRSACTRRAGRGGAALPRRDAPTREVGRPTRRRWVTMTDRNRSRPLSIARKWWPGFEPIHAVTYFAPEARDAYLAAGLRGYWRGYFAGRSAPLGSVDAAPVI